MVNECIPYFDDGDNVTFTASAAITGKKFVDITGAPDAIHNCFLAGPPAAGGRVEGVASYDAPSGAPFNVIRRNSQMVVPVTAGATITLGQDLQVDSTGAVVPFTGVQEEIGVPTISLGTAASGGSFAANTYYWVLTATTSAGETTVSNELTATLTLNQKQPINWTAVVGATGYKLYRGTVAATENVLVATLGAVTTYTDLGAAGTAATPPVLNTTEITTGLTVGRAWSSATSGNDCIVALY